LSVVSKQDPSDIPGVERTSDLGEAEKGWRKWDVRLQPGVAPGDVLERCVSEQFPLRQFEQLHASLHDVFVHIVGAPETAQCPTSSSLRPASSDRSRRCAASG
jgi:ABC-2 type transport system ATP-binding protein